MWLNKKILSGASQEMYVAVYYCRCLLIEYVTDYANKNATDDYSPIQSEEVVALVLSIQQGEYDATFFAQCNLKEKSGRAPKEIKPLLKKQVLGPIIHKFSHVFKMPKETSAPETADLSDLCNFLTGDSTLQATWSLIGNAIDRKEFSPEGKTPRTIVVTSPPWQVLHESKSKGTKTTDTTHDQKLGDVAIGHWAAAMKATLASTSTIVAVNIPIRLAHQYRENFENNGWQMMRDPLVFTTTGKSRGKNLGEHQPENNTHLWFVFHQSGQIPFRTFSAVVNPLPALYVRHVYVYT